MQTVGEAASTTPDFWLGLVAKQNGTDGHFASITDSAETAQYSAYALMALKETGEGHAAGGRAIPAVNFGYTHSSRLQRLVDDRGIWTKRIFRSDERGCAAVSITYIISGTYYTIQDAINAGTAQTTRSALLQARLP